MQPFDTLSFILRHPLAKQHPVSSLARFVRWQITSRLYQEVAVSWIDGAVLNARRGMTGATGNIYCGIHEFAEMAFLLHLLCPDDLFLDIGANIGSYTILASKVCGAHSVAFEPDPDTASSLRRNIALNAIGDRVRVEELALGAHNGEVAFTVGLDTMNRVASDTDQQCRKVQLKRLDDIPGLATAIYAKLDVEGFEDRVLLGGLNLLNSPDLLAIQCETHGRNVTEILNAHGFREYFYDPFSRSLSKESFGYKADALFVRDPARITQRVKASPKRKIFESTI